MELSNSITGRGRGREGGGGGGVRVNRMLRTCETLGFRDFNNIINKFQRKEGRKGGEMTVSSGVHILLK